jgi:hypothetical protein
MGIRFLCPNGHKLNVKAELAGKRGSCPECGAKLMIPAATAAPQQSPPAAIVVEAQSPGAPPAGTAWHLRSATGEQHGPLSELQLRAWIASGRMTANTHVWREGWPEWRLASDVADQLPTPLVAAPVAAPEVQPQPPSEFPVAVPIEAVETAVAVAPTIPELDIEPVTTGGAVNTDPAALSASAYTDQRRRNKQKQITLAIAMLVAVVVLAGVLYWVVSLNSSVPTETTTTSSPPPQQSPFQTAIA